MRDLNRRNVVRLAAGIALGTATITAVLGDQHENAASAVATAATRLSPDTIAKYDYYFQCSIVKPDQGTEVAGGSDLNASNKLHNRFQTAFVVVLIRPSWNCDRTRWFALNC